jgi:Bacterial capsule synthesis protein PGA_cap
MSCKKSLLRILLVALCAPVLSAATGSAQSVPGKPGTPQSLLSGGNSGKSVRILFTGDILLSRQVAAEIALRKTSPWKNLSGLFHSGAWVAGNLEGAVGSPSSCVASSERSPCFAIDPSMLHWLHDAGFAALGNENNHAGDLGPAGRRTTRKALAAQGLLPLTFADSPEFLRFGRTTVAIISLTVVRDHQGKPAELPSVALEQKIRLARALANLVMVSIHWGSELMDWPNQEQKRDADWLMAHGVDAIFGDHPHVVEEPECVSGRPVFYSLGNHVFDQKYPATKKGLIADCTISHGVLSCSALRTQAPEASSFPTLAGIDPAARRALAACTVHIHPTLTVSGYELRPEPSSPGNLTGKIWIEGYPAKGPRAGTPAWRTRPARVLSLEAARLKGPKGPVFLLSLEKHPSPIDAENEPRPYVYEVGRTGFIARWRGSALAWPLIDARLLPGHDGAVCALHRKDSFLVLSPSSTGTRVAAYRWNGFGFNGIRDPNIVADCKALFDGSRQVAFRRLKHGGVN